MKEKEKTELRRFLNESAVRIIYFKSDGLTRGILCTTCWDFLETDIDQNYTPPKNPKSLKEADDMHILVWDLEDKGFKSLLFDSIIKYEQVKYQGRDVLINNHYKY